MMAVLVVAGQYSWDIRVEDIMALFVMKHEDERWCPPPTARAIADEMEWIGDASGQKPQPQPEPEPLRGAPAAMKYKPRVWALEWDSRLLDLMETAGNAWLAKAKWAPVWAAGGPITVTASYLVSEMEWIGDRSGRSD